MSSTIIMFTSYFSSNLLRFIKSTFKTFQFYLPLNPSLLENADTFINEQCEKCITEHPDSGLSITQLITKYGYPVETHEVITEDGYILTVVRIKHGKKESKVDSNSTSSSTSSSSSSSKRVIFLQHGLLGSCADFLVNSSENSLPFLLADKGFDVWLGNSRGSKLSKRHTSLNPKSRKFWEFSFHEMGYYDVPASINKALEVSGQSKISWIGHSMGCAMFFIALSMRPEYNQKIDKMIALGPAVYVHNMISPLRFFAPICEQFEDIIGLEILPSGGILELIGHCLGIADITFQQFYYNLFFLICGFNVEQLNKKQLPIILQHLPSSTSYRTITHFAHLILAKDFRAYDHGAKINYEKYGQSQVPIYDLSKVTAKVAIFYGDNDWLIVPKDIDRLASELPGLIGKYRVDLDLFNHLDFLLSVDSNKLINPDILRVLNDQNHEE